MRTGRSARTAVSVLDAMRARPWHLFWSDAIADESSHLTGVIVHRQVTDAYLVALASHHGGLVATLDKGLAALHGERSVLIDAPTP